MKSMDGILKLADKEFEAIVQNGKFRSREEIDSVYKLVDIVKDVHCIWAYEEDEEGDYSEEGRSYRGGYGYDDGMSMARGRSRNARRDSMGRYSRDDGYGYRGGRSMNYSRADAKQEYIDNLHEMMMNAPDDQTRQSIQRMISQMEQG